jgi:uncharacterized cofD-like protein
VSRTVSLPSLSPPGPIEQPLSGVTAPIRVPAPQGAPGAASLRVVAIGGGTGLSTILRGFRHFVASPQGSTTVPGQTAAECDPCLISDLAAVVTVTDDGGSSGRLRKDFNILPPGDLRNCMVALSEDEGLISRLFRHRFQAGEGLQGHSFGNLFVAALTEMTGDFAQAIRLSSQVLATRGQIYPATTTDVTLFAEMDDGSIVHGETNISATKQRIVKLMIEPEKVDPLPETLEAISRADVITLGPGSLYTSLITNLLVQGIPEALAEARGVRIYISNLMTQANESLNLTASQHIEKIYEHARGPIFDYAIVNTALVSEELRKRYASEGAIAIEPDVERVEALGIKCVTGNFSAEGGVLRHAADRVAETVLRIGAEVKASKGPVAGR